MKRTTQWGAWLRRTREEQNLTGASLAELVGSTPQTFESWERGGAFPETDQLLLLAKHLHVPLEELLDSVVKAGMSPGKIKGTAIGVIGGRGEKVSRVMLFVMTTVFAVAIFVCGLVDLVLTGELTWSVFPIWSVVFAWVVFAAPLVVKRRRMLAALVSLTISLPVYLYLMLWKVALTALFFSLAVPVMGVALLYAWAVYLFAAYMPVSAWYSASAALALFPVVGLSVNRIVDRAIDVQRYNSVEWRYVAEGGILAFLLLTVILVVKGLHKGRVQR